MKKWIAMLICVSVIFSLTACGVKDYADEVKDEISNALSGETTPSVPTEEELMELELYAEILNHLEYFSGSGWTFYNFDSTNSLAGINTFDSFHYQLCYLDYFSTLHADEYDEEYFKYYWHCGLKIYYDLLLELESVDQWIGTEYAPEISREEVLDNFYIIEDVLLSETELYEHNGEFTEPYEFTSWWYNKKGQVSCIDFDGFTLHKLADPDLFYYGLFDIRDYYFVKYDLDRTLVQMYKYSDYTDSELSETIDFFYNNDGKLTEVKTVRYDSGNTREDYFEFLYTEEDRLFKVIQNDGECIADYRYDDTGRVTKIKLSYDFGDEYIFVYTYDDAGKVIRVEEKFDDYRFNGHTTNLVEFVETWEITYDDRGRIAECIYEDYQENRYQYVVTYGDFYGYNPS